MRPGDTIDLEAQARGTSVYFPDRVYPMVPERLSDDLCSLRPGENRLVQSVVIDFDRKAEVVGDALRRRRHPLGGALDLHAGRRSARRAERARAAVRARSRAMLRSAEALRERLETRRRARGSVDFDLPAPTILLDVEGVMTGIKIEPRNRAHRMIEEFMLAANEAVATWLSADEVPCLFRIHDNPDPLKIEGLVGLREVARPDAEVGPRGVRPGDIQRLLDDAEGLPALPGGHAACRCAR